MRPVLDGLAARPFRRDKNSRTSMCSEARTASGSVRKAASFPLYFSKGDPFDLDHWQVPEAFDWGKWEVDSKSADAVRFRKRMSLTNYSGTPLEVDVDRRVRLLRPADFATYLGAELGPAIRMVGFESSNTITNAGRERWQRKSGLVSVWILGMFAPSPSTTITIPFVPAKTPNWAPP
jgi:hypothetical protein